RRRLSADPAGRDRGVGRRAVVPGVRDRRPDRDQGGRRHRRGRQRRPLVRDVKLLLTSAGVRNASIESALVELLGKPIADADALCIPTAAYGSSYSTPVGPWRFITGNSPQPMTGLGWKSVGVLELTALPSMDAERWIPWVRDTDALLVNGGD